VRDRVRHEITNDDNARQCRHHLDQTGWSGRGGEV
jgi:hypothetical protein